MNGLIDWSIARARTVLTLLLVGLLLGIIAYRTIPKEADPDIPIPFIFVSLSLQGISPEDSERLLIRPMETRLQSIEGLKDMRSYARLGGGGILLEFDVNFDVDQALIDVREQVDIAKADLPDEADEPLVEEFNASLFPVIIVTLSGQVPERALFRLARDTEDALEALPGVLEAELAGQREELLEILIDPAALESYALNQQDLINAVTLNNRLVAAGALDTGEGRFNIKVPGLFETAEDVMSLVVKRSGDGVVTFADIGEIRRTFMDADGFARFDGRPTIALQVKKRIGSNIIEVTDAVRATVDELSLNWPEGVKVAYSLDASSWIDSSIANLQASILTAVSLVMIIVVAALGFRSAVLVGIAIPASILFAILAISAMGLTLNMMIMFGAVIAVGMLVDGAIVVVEYADRKMQEGFHRREAYSQAAKRMSWPIVSSTATTLAAFFPMLFWPGVPGKFMSFLPITVIFVLSASLLVALIFLPVLGSVFGAANDGDGEAMKVLGEAETVEDLERLPGLTGIYARTVAKLVHHPGKVMLVALGLIIGIYSLFVLTFRGVEFFVDAEPDNLITFVRARGNLSAAKSRDLAIEIESIVRQVKGVEHVFLNTQTPGASGSSQAGGGQGSEPPSDTIGTLTIELMPYGTRPGGDTILDDIRARTAHIPGVIIEAREQEQGPPSGKDVQMELASYDHAALNAAAARVRHHLEIEMDGLIDIEDTRPLPGIEWELMVDREQAGRFGADIAAIGATVQMVTNGILIGKYRPDDSEDEIDIRVRFPEIDRGIDQLDRLRITTERGLVPIGNFVERRPRPQVTSLERVNGKRVLTVRANAAPGILADDKVSEIKGWLEDASLDPRVAVAFRGADEEQKESADFLGKALMASLFLMALILITQFNNFYHSALILSAIVLSTVGVMLGIAITGQTFSIIMTGTGIVALAGIVVNNNIVLIDTYQRLRASGLEAIDAIVRTAAQRVRPVVLTTITTICGLLPMALQLNVDFFAREVSIGSQTSAWWVQLATAVVFGLGFSTLLTLVLTPCLLSAPVVWGAGGRRPKRLAAAVARAEGAIRALDTRVKKSRPAREGSQTDAPGEPAKTAAE